MDYFHLRNQALQVFQAALEAVDSRAATRRNLSLSGESLTIADRSYDLSNFECIYVVGAGKASAAMGQAVEEVLGDRVEGGHINVKAGHTRPLEKIALTEASHPVPDQQGVEGARRIVEILRRAGERDLVLCLLSGGGSALLPYPVDGLTLEDKQKTTQLLLECGATIHEINAIRKHISQTKGGNLARVAAPATLVSLILSDVVGDDLDSVASGPTVPDRSTFAGCSEIIRKYDLEGRLPSAVARHLERGARGEVEDTPKSGDPAFERTQNVIVASNALAVEAARKKASHLGYRPLVLSTLIEGETEEAARFHAAIAREVLRSGNPIASPACLISGGETTVTIKGKGKGGRNQHFSLAAALELEEAPGVLVLSAGTDGTDGPTDAAGAFADGRTVRRGEELGLDARAYLRENDSYHFFEALGDLLITGPTHTNVMDLRLLFIV